jgi:hypothetical protein
LSCFDFKITYRKGELMQADTLSRFSKDQISDKEDNRQVQVLKPEHFIRAAKAHFVPEVDSLGDCIRWASLREVEVIKGLKSIDKTAPKALPTGLQGGKKTMGSFITRVDYTSRTTASCVKMWLNHATMQSLQDTLVKTEP